MDTPGPNTYETDVCIVGGGPAGVLLGLLLARQNIRALVLEQHPDFEREYRGEVLMPRFSQLFSQLGLLQYMESFPHSKLTKLDFHNINGLIGEIKLHDVCPEFPFAVWMPQPIFLNALHQKAQESPNYTLWFNALANQLITRGGKTEGLIAKVNNQNVEIRAKVTVGADGRFSKIHQLGHYQNSVDEHKFDILWFSLPRPAGYEGTVRAYLGKNRMCLVIPKYPDLVQCGMQMQADEFIQLKKQGIEAFKQLLTENGPQLFQEFAKGLTDFKPFHPLQARVSFVERWAKDGLLLIGDSAHTCSPVIGIGVSVAITTAAVAADVIARAIGNNDVSAEALDEVQQVREAEVRKIQNAQGRLSNTLMMKLPFLFKLLPFVIRLLINLGLSKRVIREIAASEDNNQHIAPYIERLNKNAKSIPEVVTH